MVSTLPRPADLSSDEHRIVALDAERIANGYLPAYVVIDDLDDVVLASRSADRFLQSGGTATHHLPSLVHQAIAPELLRLVQWSRATGRPGRTGELTLPTIGGATRLVVAVELLPIPRRLMVLFQDSDPAGSGYDRQGQQGGLEARLRSAGEQLRRATDKLAVRDAEHEGFAEELQSSHKELKTANDELGTRLAELNQANSDIGHMLQSTRIAIVFLDAQLRIRSFTPAVRDIFRLVDRDVGRPLTEIPAQLVYPDLASDLQHVLHDREVMEREVDGHAGTRRFLVRLLPDLDGRASPVGVVLAFIDVSAAHQANQARRDSEERARCMAASVPAFLFIALPNGEWDYVNPPFYAFTGMADDQALGAGWLAVVHPSDRDAIHPLWRSSPGSAAAIERELRFWRVEGGWCWFLLRAVPQLGEDGQVVRWYGSCIDIDQRRQSEARQSKTLADLQHRVKNILALVRSLLARTLGYSADLEHFSRHFTGRIDALARTQTIAARTPERLVMLDELVAEELAAHGGQDERQTHVAGPDVALPGKTAELLGLALHELSTNALKYGGLSTRTGRVDVQWTLAPTGQYGAGTTGLSIHWLESGVPLTDLSPARRGFGRELIERGLPYELGAETSLEFRPGGLYCRIVLAVAARGKPAAHFGVAW